MVSDFSIPIRNRHWMNGQFKNPEDHIEKFLQEGKGEGNIEGSDRRMTAGMTINIHMTYILDQVSENHPTKLLSS